MQTFAKHLFVIALLISSSFSIQAQLLRTSQHSDTTLPRIETNPDYGFVFPVNADILNQNNYTPSFSNRYFMSLFGPRYLSTSSSSIGYYDFHQGADVTYGVSWNGINYDQTTLYHIVCNCDGVIEDILDSTDVYLETTGQGRSVKVKCDSSFHNDNWGSIYINFRHLSDLYTLADSAKNEPSGTVRINKGDTVGIVGESGITSTVHLHTSIQRYETGTNTTNFKNIHPYRIFPLDTVDHLHKILEYAQFKLLESWADSALFRIYIPYNEQCVKRLEVINNSYSNIFDFEDVSDSTDRDNHALISGFEVFAYSFNRGSTALSRYNSTKGSMPEEYPASPNRDTVNSYFFPITEDTTVYIMDVKLTDLPNNFDTLDFVLKLSDIYGNVSMGDYGTVWDGSSWSDGAPSASVNAIIASSTTPGAFDCRNLTINHDVTLNLGSSDVTISGNVSNYGNGINGTGTITFDKSGTAILFEDTLSYEGIIEVASGTTLQSNGLLELTASSDTTYGRILGDGSVSGNVGVQVHLTGIDQNNARFFHLGPPVTNTILSDFNEGQIMVANSGSSGTVWTWNAATATWDAPSSLSDTAKNGTGYAIYAGTNSFGTFLRDSAGTIELNGSVPMIDVSTSIDYHNGQGVGQNFVSGTGIEDTEGWNLIANPFPCPYDWDQQSIPTDMANAIYVFDGTNYNSYVSGVGTASRYLAPFQGFFVQLTENTPGNISFSANARISSENPAIATGLGYIIDGINLEVHSVTHNTQDQVFLGFDVNATVGFDKKYDARKITNPNGVPSIYSKSGSENYSIDRIPVTGQNVEVFPVSLNHNTHNDTLTFSAEISRLSSYSTVWLMDNKNGGIIDIGTQSYSAIHDTGYVHRYLVLFSNIGYPFDLIESEAKNSWFTYNNEEGIVVRFNDSQKSKIKVFDVSGKLIYKDTHRSAEVTISLPKKGVYQIMVKRNGKTETRKLIF